MDDITASDVLLHDISMPSSTHIAPPAPAPPLREKNKRPQLSCNPCRARKVKVGLPSDGTFGSQVAAVVVDFPLSSVIAFNLARRVRCIR